MNSVPGTRFDPGWAHRGGVDEPGARRAPGGAGRRPSSPSTATSAGSRASGGRSFGPDRSGRFRRYDAAVAEDLHALEERLRATLQRHARVLVAYLFGSTARGRAGPLSDVDVAVLLAEDGDPFPAYLDLVGELGSVVGPDRVDVVLLNDAPVALAYRVLRDGRLLLCRDEAARVEHWVRTVLTYLDMEPLFRIFDEGLRHRIREGRFGRP